MLTFRLLDSLSGMVRLNVFNQRFELGTVFFEEVLLAWIMLLFAWRYVATVGGFIAVEHMLVVDGHLVLSTLAKVKTTQVVVNLAW